MSQSPDANEAAILDWLEDGEEVEEEEKYWRKTITHNEPVKGDTTTDKSVNRTQEIEQKGASDDVGVDGGTVGREPASVEDRLKAETKTRLRKAFSILSDLAEVVLGFVKSLRTTDWMLLEAVLVLLVVVALMLFPGTLAWFKIVVNVRKWPWWIWTCISLAVLGFLVWLRGRYE